MAKYKPYNYSQSVLLPVYLDAQLMPGTLEFAIHTLVEERLDMSVFDQKYNNDDTGCAAYDPKVHLEGGFIGLRQGAYLFEKDRAGLERKHYLYSLKLRPAF